MADAQGFGSDRLSLLVTHANGQTTRWGPDELDNGQVPVGLQFKTSLPGGFSEASCELLRRIDLDHPDEGLFDDVKVLGPGNEIAWQGRMSQFPRAHGDSFSTHPGAEGWSAHLSDQMFREIYVDCDKGAWSDLSATRRSALIASNYGVTASTTDTDPTTGAGVRRLTMKGTWGTASKGYSAAMYDAKGLPIGSVYYAWSRGTTVDQSNTSWYWHAFAGTDDSFASVDITANLRAAGPGSGTLTTTATRTFAGVQFYFDAAGGDANKDYDLNWTCLAVYGSHGLTPAGTSGTVLAPGFYASDVITNAVRRGAPLINITADSIASTSVVLPQLVFSDADSTVRKVIEKCNAPHLWDWVVYDNRTLYFRQPDPSRLTWVARVGDGVKLSLDGLDSSDVYTGVVVKYTSASTGSERTVGPPGSGADATDTSLQDTSDTNPAVAHGITRHYVLSLSDVATDDFAIAVGAAYLAEHLSPQRRGQAVLSGTVRHPTAGSRPVWAVRAGDYIDFVDTNDNSLGGPRRVVATAYDHDNRQNTLTLDNTAYTTEALLSILTDERTR